MTKVAVVLSGCGYLDGAEVREAVLALLALDKAGAEVSIFAPDIDQHHVVNHLTGEETKETRNVLVESARIARGDVKPLSEAKEEAFDALVLPGGFGVAKNLSDIAFKGPEGEVMPEFAQLIQAFYRAGKPIGAICIAPAALVKALAGETKAHVTIGEDADGLIAGLGGEHQDCATRGMVIDDTNHLVSCSAYMRDDAPLADVASGIFNVVEAVLNQAEAQKKAA